MIFKTVYGTGQGLKAAWNYAVGNNWLDSRGIDRSEDSTSDQIKFASVLLLGSIGVAIGGPAAGLFFQSVWLGLGVAAAAPFLAPILLHQPYALYQAGKHDYEQEQKALAQEKQSAPAALPAPIKLS
jgi:hypothetical protein